MHTNTTLRLRRLAQAIADAEVTIYTWHVCEGTMVQEALFDIRGALSAYHPMSLRWYCRYLVCVTFVVCIVI